MKVRVIKASNWGLWYSNCVGHIFLVLDTLEDETAYQVQYAPRFPATSYIQFDDCEVVPDYFQATVQDVPDKAPPLGIKPAQFVAEARIIEIAEAIIRYTKEGLFVPDNWLDELKDQLSIREAYKV